MTENSCGKTGKAGEKSCYQFMRGTWREYSLLVLGYEAPLTEGNAEYVAVRMIQRWIDQGITAEKIALKWNQGNTGRCVAKAGAYDSCAYQKKFIRHHRDITTAGLTVAGPGLTGSVATGTGSRN